MQYLYRKIPALAKKAGEKQVPRLRSNTPSSANSAQVGDPVYAPLGITERATRRRAIAITSAILLAASLCVAQIRDRTQHQQQSAGDSNQSQSNAKQTKRGPRAIAVLEFLPGGGARLVPVALWIDDRFYDASLYGADPEPMALQPETVYEATDYGESTGLFTVTTPEQVKGNWVGAGQWKPHRALEEQLAKQAASKPKRVQVDNPLADRPTLRRSGSSDSSSGSSASASPSSGASSSSGSASSSTNSESPNPNEPPDRPTLKKPSESSEPPPSQPQATTAGSSSTSSASSASPDENDPNRPVLRRGKPASQAADVSQPYQATASQPGTATKGAQAKLVTTMALAGRHSYPAISDATQHEMRSLLYAMNAAERTEKSELMSALAMADVQKFVAKRNTPGLPKNATITDYDLRAYDLEYRNAPTFVFTGKLRLESAKALRGGEFDYFVTVVAREDVNGTLIEIFHSVTDSNHLDAFARMEIIDAVDADANGRGDLLFRLYSDTGVSYGLYRVYPYEMKQIFEGGSGV